MNSSFESSFIFVVCQIGAEPALKKEIARDHPELRFAYSKPGFLTFKKVEGKMDLQFALRSVFARAYGISLGAVPSASGDLEIAAIVQFAHELRESHTGSGFRLHLWERDQHPPGESPLGFQPGAIAQEFKIKLMAHSPELFANPEKAEPGDIVLDLVALDKESLWMGAHMHSVIHSPWPGGAFPISLPDDSPSRAYLKLEESLNWAGQWAGSPTRAGDTAVEIGSAPGGASFALLQRGLRVVGIDPAEMDPKILRNPNFLHFQRPVASIPREELPESIQWLLLDMNVEPRISLFAVDRLVSRMKDSVLGVILTIKLNRWEIADEIPMMLAHVREMGMVRVKAAQLSHHRQEIVIFGLTRKGTVRKGITPNA
ncbi:MAG: SAM-dependent methyltransferase [Bdellovibrionia bacterium]